MSDYYLELSENPVRFEADNQMTKVFFDDSNKHVFAVRSGGVMGVVVKGPTEEKPINFRMEDKGPVLSIKFSLDKNILAIQRTNTSVEFINFVNGNIVEGEYSQTCKKGSAILGFVWLPHSEVSIITDHGIELYLVIPEKRNLKHLKTTSANTEWFVWCPTNKIALLASSHGSSLQPVQFKQGMISKLPKVETEPGRMALERNVVLATLYSVPAVLIVRHSTGPQTSEVHVHTLSGPGQAPVKSHVLKLGLSGRFAINIVDDLILVHHQASRSSQIFDVGLPGESDGNVRYHVPIAPARSFKPTYISLPGLVEPEKHLCELYSPNWVVFQPDIVIDAILGCLWHIKLCLPDLLKQISDLSVCTQVALKRTNGKSVLLSIILETVKQQKPPLDKLQDAFNHINNIYRNWIEVELQSQTAIPAGTSIPLKAKGQPRVLIEQTDAFNEIFLKLELDEEQKLEWTLICYLTSLSEHGIQAQHDVNELLLKTLARRKKFTTLQQLLQYGVISDSKLLACSLLSLGNMHPSAIQLAMDMLARLDAREEIQEILLSQGQVLSALKLCKDGANPRKFLEAAKNTGDDKLLHSVLYYFKNNPQQFGLRKVKVFQWMSSNIRRGCLGNFLNVLREFVQKIICFLICI